MATSNLTFNLNWELTQALNVAATLPQETAVTIGDVSATMEIDMSASLFNEVFRFATDATNMSDISSADISYSVTASNMPDIAFSSGAVTSNHVLTANALVKNDHVHHQANQLFGTPHGVDIFSNEEALVNDIVTIDASFNEDIDTILASSGTDASPKTDADGNDNNPSKILLDRLLNQVASSNNTTLDARLTDMLSNSSDFQYFTFETNDKLCFKVQYNPQEAGSAHAQLQNKTPCARSYKVQINML